jgi:hypothetical protein
MYSSRYSCWIVMKQIFEKISARKFYQNPSSGSWVVSCGQTDGNDKADSRFSRFLRMHLKIGTSYVTLFFYSLQNFSTVKGIINFPVHCVFSHHVLVGAAVYTSYSNNTYLWRQKTSVSTTDIAS